MKRPELGVCCATQWLVLTPTCRGIRAVRLFLCIGFLKALYRPDPIYTQHSARVLQNG